MTARASDEWTRSYQLDPDGEVQVFTTDGSVTVEATSGSTVDVRAERTVYAMTEESAREVLTRVTIRETVEPAKVAIQTQALGGIVIGVRVSVSYVVQAPRTAVVRARSRNGDVTVKGFSGNVFANAANGALVGEALSGGVEARVSNGDVKLSLAEVGDQIIDVRAGNGNIELLLPETAAATVQATFGNGRFDVAGLAFERIGESTPRRVRGRVNAGGTPIELSAGNGAIRLASPNAPATKSSPEAEAPRQRP